MILNNIKTRQKDSGFTIVELLVVIVVIGILAAITIVSYSGITARATTQSNKSNASSVLNAALVVNANTGSFPATSGTSSTVFTNLNAGDAKIPSGFQVTNAVTASGTIIRYLLNAAAATATGVCVTYWDYTASAKDSLFGGVATADSNADATAASCT